ncbi:Multidrug resistance protein MdtA [Vibrio stylophorae]|uniref:Multidrug resistance protein MdtA n=1 Tax=Vibrio stylophorae TaxID=659351 RepID=A0ABM8ZRA0_9VIBR|nr:efflux RND transporter periplasmic adaptor subunit [Vibrio stylophorae]CAH0532749.1 Multidrug resistance protein MdtA [Vibrio stylophorae]
MLLRKWILPIALLLLAVLGYQWISAKQEQAPAKPVGEQLMKVQTQVLQAQSLTVMLEGFAEVTPVERTQIASQVAGEVLAWHPNFVAGGRVERGTVLFSIDPSNYQAAVLMMEAELAQAQAAYIEEKARGKVAARQAQSIPDKQVTALYLRKPQLLSASARVKSARAALQRAKRDLENCQVKAPYDALVISRQIGVGQYLNVGSPIAELYNIESAELIVPIAGFDVPFLARPLADSPVAIHIPGQPDTQWQGRLNRDLGVVDSATRMLQLVVHIDDPYGIHSQQPPLPFGSYVAVQFAGKTLNNLFQVPQELVRDSTLWLIDDQNQLQPRTVNVRRQVDRFFYLDHGVAIGDEMVLTLPEFPYQGMPVERLADVRPSAPNKGAERD